MFNNLTALGMGIIVFAIVIGVGSVVTYQFAGAVGCDGSASLGSWNATAGKCQNATAQITPTSSGYTNVNYMTTQLGTSGLAGWTPAVIALAVGLLFIGALMMKKGQTY